MPFRTALNRRIPVWQTILIAVFAVVLTALLNLWLSRPSPLRNFAESPSLGVEELVQRLRSELETMEMHRMNNAEPVLFQMKDFDLELSFVVKASEKQNGKLEYKIVTAEMEKELGNEQTHKITLHMAVIPPENAHLDAPAQHLSIEGAIQLPVLKKEPLR